MDPEQALEAMQALQLLAVTREGPLGVKTVNATLEQVLRQRRRLRETDTWYPGRPVIILRNDYRMNLFNGDMGITLPDPDNPGQMRVWFRDQQGQLHGHHPARLPQHETAYAITVHKSQGSEYDQVILLLPHQPTPLLSRELLYTAVSRARHRFQAWGPIQRLEEALHHGVERHSGLIDKLWQ
jgi:exodeoxyribonuclease V alpha subunit